jgi:hypothetical protein
MEKYESRERDCWIIKDIPRDSLKNFFSIKEKPTVYERNTKKNPNLIPIYSKSTTFPPLRFK